MSREILLAKIDEEIECAEFEEICGDGGWSKGAKALRAVVTLHQQNHDNSCSHCVTWYPCETIKVIELEIN